MKPRYDMIQCFVLRPTTNPDREHTHDFLQMRRAAGDFMGGTWQTVYGRIEADETAWQAALRELREETGLAPVQFYQLDTVNTFYLAATDEIWHVPMFCAIVDPQAQVTLNAEHDAVRWLAQTEATDAFIWPGEKLALIELFREILGDGQARPHMLIDPRMTTDK